MSEKYPWSSEDRKQEHDASGENVEKIFKLKPGKIEEWPPVYNGPPWVAFENPQEMSTRDILDAIDPEGKYRIEVTDPGLVQLTPIQNYLFPCITVTFDKSYNDVIAKNTEKFVGATIEIDPRYWGIPMSKEEIDNLGGIPRLIDRGFDTLLKHSYSKAKDGGEITFNDSIMSAWVFLTEIAEQLMGEKERYCLRIIAPLKVARHFLDAILSDSNNT